MELGRVEGYPQTFRAVSTTNSSFRHCWHPSFPGWQRRQCSSSYYPWGPDQVWIDITGYFYNAPTQVEYTQYAKFTATPNG